LLWFQHQFAQFDAQVGDDAGHVRGADDRVGQLGHHRVLQPHDETQQHHGERHQQPFKMGQPRAHQPETQDECGLK
jgi:hypothetical protein